MASVLFIAPADLGEAVLASGALAFALEGGRELTVACAPEAAELLRAAPGLVALHRIKADGGPLHWVEVWRTLASKGFDVVLDARGGVLGKSLRASRHIAPRPSPVLRHRAEDWTDWMGAERALAPKLWIDDAARASAAEAAPGAGALIALAPGGVTRDKIWPAERFAAVARRLVGGPLEGARVVLLGAARRDAEITRAIAQSLDADGIAAADLTGKLDLLGAAALLENATLCLGNDNALAHIAAAVGAPTLTLFGPTDERVRAPYGPRARALRGRALEELLTRGAKMSLMDDVSVDSVEAAALELLHAGGLR